MLYHGRTRNVQLYNSHARQICQSAMQLLNIAEESSIDFIDLTTNDNSSDIQQSIVNNSSMTDGSGYSHHPCGEEATVRPTMI